MNTRITGVWILSTMHSRTASLCMNTRITGVWIKMLDTSFKSIGLHEYPYYGCLNKVKQEITAILSEARIPVLRVFELGITNNDYEPYVHEYPHYVCLNHGYYDTYKLCDRHKYLHYGCLNLNMLYIFTHFPHNILFLLLHQDGYY